jgi:exodeoxyribonuclease V alpha subunit
VTLAVASIDQQLWDWCKKIREPLKAQYSADDECALIAWELARWQDGLLYTEQQALILLILTVLVHLRQGSTRIRLRGPEGRLMRLDLAARLLKGIESAADRSDVEPVAAVELIETLIDSQRLTAVVGSAQEFKPLIVAGDHLYLQKMFYLEGRFVDVLGHRLTADVETYDEARIDRAVRDVVGRPSARNGHTLALKDEQVAAVRIAMLNRMTIISGGPGTGKTTIVLSILRVLRRLGVACEEIALAAPTGKAANRMGEAIQGGLTEIALPAAEDLDLSHLGEPRTLHRLLGYSPRTGRFVHHENNRLAQRVVIVDEGSMIDLALMERLVRSLRDGSRFILLGDAHQLPSVDAGDVLRDLLEVSAAGAGASTTPVGVRLTESHRMRQDDENGRNILAVARVFDLGEKPVIAATRASDPTIVERASVAEIQFRGVEFLVSFDGPVVLDAFLERWHRHLIRGDRDVNEIVQRDFSMTLGKLSEVDQSAIERCFRHWERFRILCVTRVSQTTGSDRLNEALHQRVIDERNLAPHRENELIAGEPVIMQVNDYGRGIFNGDQGLLLNIAERGRPGLMAVFRRSGTESFAAFAVDSLRPVLVHAYAMTVHKAQGSEFDTLALVLPDRDLPINSREILYTALTRSRQGVVIVGAREILEAGIKRTIARDSGIVEKFKRSLPD